MDITKRVEMVLHHSEQSDVTVNAMIKDETIWISQKAMMRFQERLYSVKTIFVNYLREFALSELVKEESGRKY